ncbi:hypothetical protein DPMN_157296 [Dreissena polymorpha]|uniref:Uncharacterized protein n=1 Tax=Dreissena polymorpha TaxID=45954 RepID=A0A9D4IPV7_DREPO|nr:hypothetical protein DPMN_157296 [Dreissena polymorpha]
MEFKLKGSNILRRTSWYLGHLALSYIYLVDTENAECANCNIKDEQPANAFAMPTATVPSAGVATAVNAIRPSAGVATAVNAIRPSAGVATAVNAIRPSVAANWPASVETLANAEPDAQGPYASATAAARASEGMTSPSYSGERQN